MGILAILIVGKLLFNVHLPVISVAPEGLPNPEHPIHIGPLTLTNALLTSWIVSIFIIIFTLLATVRLRIVPGGLQNLTEMLIGGFYDLTEDIAGPRLAPRIFPIAMTIFLYVLFSNWLDLLTPLFAAVGVKESHDGHEAIIPILRSPSTDLNMTLALALVSVVLIQYFGVRELGLRYFSKFINVGGLQKYFAARSGEVEGNPMGLLLQGLLDFVIGLIELISEMARILSFSFRLFGNIFAGEVLLLVMPTFFSLLLPLPFLGLELFVGVIQAFIFAVLTIAFITQATMSHDGH
jgi:F-type H+-transporting ATPase subunit a